MRRSAPSTISTVMPASRPPRDAARGFSRRGCLQRYLRRRVRRHLRRRPARRRRALAGVSRRGPALRARAGSGSGGIRPRRSRSKCRSSSECETCHGSGAAKGSQRRSPATPAAALARCASRRASSSCSRPVRAAAARARSCKNPCDTCLGQGRVRRAKKLSVKVPAGVDTGDRIRLAGEGEAGRNGGPAGDLYVEVRVREHAIFERDGEH